MDKLKIAMPILVEGRYDKIKLTSLVDGNIITTDGFAIFNDKEKLALVRRMAVDGIIVLCDPDGGGAQIRRFLSGALPSDKIYHLHIPAIEGKERRKKTAGRAGTLGVEGVDAELLRSVLAPFAGDTPPSRAALTRMKPPPRLDLMPWYSAFSTSGWSSSLTMYPSFSSSGTSMA